MPIRQLPSSSFANESVINEKIANLTITGGKITAGTITLDKLDSSVQSNVNLGSPLKANIADLTTANVTEVTNQYFTNARVYANVTQLGYATTTHVANEVANLVNSAPSTLDTLKELSDALGADPNFATTITNQLANKANTASLTTANVTEVTNQYFTNARAYANVVELGYITSSSLSGYATNTQLSLYATNAQLTSYALSSDLTTANVSELTNFYFTNSRVYSNVNEIGYATIAQVAVKANVVDLTTSNVVENGNLYFTSDRANTAIDNKVTKAFVETLGIEIPNNHVMGYILGLQIEPTGVTPTTYGGSSNVPVLTIDVTGRVVSASNVSVAGVSSFTSSGNSFTISTADGNSFTANIQPDSVRLGTDTTGAYVANLVQGSGISLTNLGNEGSTPSVALSSSGVVANTYGGASKVPVIEVDQFGRITSAANVNVAGVTNFVASGNTFTISTADGGSFSASIQENSVRLGIDTTGDYVKNVIPSTGITVSGTTGETRDATIALADTTVIPATYGSADKVSSFTVDQQGRLTSASNVTISIPSSALNTDVVLGTQTSGAYIANLVAGTGVTLTGLGNESTTPTISIGQNVSSNSDVIFANVTVTGNLLVQGNTIEFSANTLVINDPLIQVGKNPVGDAVDLGFFGHYIGGSPSTERHAGLFRDATDGQFKLFTNLDPEPETIVDTANASYQSANLVVNFVIGKVTDISNHSTTGLAEGSNQYFTNARVFANVSEIGYATIAQVAVKANVNDLTTANVSELTNLYFTNARTYANVTQIGYATIAQVSLKANITDLTTSNVTEGTNLYFTNTRAREAISVTGAGTYDSSTGIITITGGVTSVGGATGAVSNAQLASGITSSGLLTTANISELTNQYFTNTRVYANVTQIGYATIAQVAVKANINDLTTANVSELNNLYFTNARAYANVIQSGFSKITVSTSLPANPNLGDKWIDTGNLIEFTYINDGDSDQWIQLGVPASAYDTAQIENAYNQANAAYTRANVVNNSLTTANVTELTNLYFTNARTYSNVTQIGYTTTGKAIAMALVFGG